MSDTPQCPPATCRYDDTLQVIDNVALPGQHIIVGSSIGAWIALKAAAARRERIKVSSQQAARAHCWCSGRCRKHNSVLTAMPMQSK